MSWGGGERWVEEDARRFKRRRFSPDSPAGSYVFLYLGVGGGSDGVDGRGLWRFIQEGRILDKSCLHPTLNSLVHACTASPLLPNIIILNIMTIDACWELQERALLAANILLLVYFSSPAHGIHPATASFTRKTQFK
jgi:hypothetical protein